MKVPYLLYCFKLIAFPKSKPIHNLFTNCAPFPSISNPYPSPYGFPLHWRALLASNIHGALTWYICHQGSRQKLLLGEGEDGFKDTQTHLHKNSVSPRILATLFEILKNAKFKYVSGQNILKYILFWGGGVPCWFLDRIVRRPQHHHLPFSASMFFIVFW